MSAGGFNIDRDVHRIIKMTGETLERLGAIDSLNLSHLTAGRQLTTDKEV